MVFFLLAPSTAKDAKSSLRRMHSVSRQRVRQPPPVHGHRMVLAVVCVGMSIVFRLLLRALTESSYTAIVVNDYLYIIGSEQYDPNLEEGLQNGKCGHPAIQPRLVCTDGDRRHPTVEIRVLCRWHRV